MAPSKRQSVNSLIINRVHKRDSLKAMIDAGLQRSSEFLWKIFMKYTHYSKQESQLFKDPTTGDYVKKYPEKERMNCIVRARKEW